MEVEQDRKFHWADYAVFAAFLAISLIIGLAVFFLDCRKKDRQNTREYLLGGKRMNAIAVGLSMCGSVLNAVLLLGFPIEVYYYNTQFSFSMISFALALVITAHVFVPFYRKYDITSCHEYLEKRFDSVVIRILAAAVFVIASILFLAVVIYTPALAIMQVTGVDKTVSISVCGVVCMIYVALGGMKAVVWTDAVQIVTVLAGMLALTIAGTAKAGGAQHVWDYAKEKDRIQFTIIDPHPMTRTTFWTQCIGLIFSWLPTFAANQMVVQRFFVVETTKQAQLGLYISILAVLSVVCMVTMLALTMYSYYAHADPFICKKIAKPDQLIPYFLMEVLGSYHGLPGLFVAAIFAAALSSVSSAVNSLAAVVVEDFIKPAYRYRKQALSASTCLSLARFFSFFFGLLAICVSFATEHMGEQVVQIQLQIFGTVLSPLFGVFFMGAFIPCINVWGACIGLLGSLLFNLWISIGNIIYVGRPRPTPPIGNNCSLTSLFVTEDLSTVSAFTSAPLDTFTNFTTPITAIEEPFSDFFRISYVWFGLLGFVVCVVVGVVVSLVATGIKASCTKKGPDNSEYLMPCTVNVYRCCYPKPENPEHNGDEKKQDISTTGTETVYL